MNQDIAFMLLMVLFVMIVIFLIFREIFCWYWKINERLSKMAEIRTILIRIEDAISESILSRSQEVISNHPKVILCAGCGKEYGPESSGEFCQSCGTRL